MTLQSTFIELPLSQVNLGDLGRNAARKVDFSVDRTGLPSRQLRAKFDDKLMGDLAADAFASWLSSFGDLEVVSYDNIRTDNFVHRDPGWDVAVGHRIPPIGKWSSPWQAPPHLWTISVKSSRIPASDMNATTAVLRRDFKILRYSSDIRHDLHADIETQVYFPPSRESGQSLSIDELQAASRDNLAAEALAKYAGGISRFSPGLLVRFASSQLLASRVRSTFRMPGLNKVFWSAPLKELGSNPAYLPEALKEPADTWALNVQPSGWRPTPIDPESS